MVILPNRILQRMLYYRVQSYQDGPNYVSKVRLVMPWYERDKVFLFQWKFTGTKVEADLTTSRLFAPPPDLKAMEQQLEDWVREQNTMTIRDSTRNLIDRIKNKVKTSDER